MSEKQQLREDLESRELGTKTQKNKVNIWLRCRKHRQRDRPVAFSLVSESRILHAVFGLLVLHVLVSPCSSRIAAIEPRRQQEQ